MLFARASLKQMVVGPGMTDKEMLSRAFCAGLIEATATAFSAVSVPSGYPVLFARASLKQIVPEMMQTRFFRYPVLFARASLKLAFAQYLCNFALCYPVLFARASLKHYSIGSENGLYGVIPCFLRGPH